MREGGKRDIRIHSTAVIQSVIQERTWKAALPNGKVILAFRKPKQAIGAPELQPGDVVKVSLSLLDFSKGEVLPG